MFVLCMDFFKQKKMIRHICFNVFCVVWNPYSCDTQTPSDRLYDEKHHEQHTRRSDYVTITLKAALMCAQAAP